MSTRDFNPIIYNNYNIQIIYNKLYKPKIQKYSSIFSNKTLREAILNSEKNLDNNNLSNISVIENINKKSRNKIKNKSVEENQINISKINRDTLFYFPKSINKKINHSQSENINKLTNYYKNINNRFINISNSNKLYHFKYHNLKNKQQKFIFNYKIKKLKPILYPSIHSQMNIQNSNSFQKNDSNFSFEINFNKKITKLNNKNENYDINIYKKLINKNLNKTIKDTYYLHNLTQYKNKNIYLIKKINVKINN
jgi:hypothetical protein